MTKLNYKNFTGYAADTIIVGVPCEVYWNQGEYGGDDKFDVIVESTGLGFMPKNDNMKYFDRGYPSHTRVKWRGYKNIIGGKLL